jgi:H+-transporting ATPase
MGSSQIIATLIAVYGFFMTPLGWGWAGFVWGYALLWFLLNDRLKLFAYRYFDPVKVKLPADITPQIAKSAYKLYEQQGRREGYAEEDWLKAEKNIKKNEFHKKINQL